MWRACNVFLQLCTDLADLIGLPTHSSVADLHTWSLQWLDIFCFLLALLFTPPRTVSFRCFPLMGLVKIVFRCGDITQLPVILIFACTIQMQTGKTENSICEDVWSLESVLQYCCSAILQQTCCNFTFYGECGDEECYNAFQCNCS